MKTLNAPILENPVQQLKLLEYNPCDIENGNSFLNTQMINHGKSKTQKISDLTFLLEN